MNKLHGRSVLVQDVNVDKSLRKFKKKIQESNLLNDLKDREFYTKPTTARKLKASAARARWKKKLRAQELPTKLYWCILRLIYTKYIFHAWTLPCMPGAIVTTYLTKPKYLESWNE